MTKLTKFFFTFSFSLALASSASAQLIVHGTGPAQACYISAKTGNPGKTAAIRECELALEELALTRKDRAATHVNLGVLLMRKGNNEKAQIQYKHAIELSPKIPEAYINHGASLIYTGNYQAAIAAINTAIELGTEKMPEALFNRAMAYDRVQNYKSAYKDLKQALVLKPDWPIAIEALENYQVTSRVKTN